MKKVLNGNFQQLMMALTMSHYGYLAKELNRAMKGIGTTESILIDIICTATTSDINIIKTMYQARKYLCFWMNIIWIVLFVCFSNYHQI